MEEIKIDTSKSLYEQGVPSCKSCKQLENNYCKEHWKDIENTENTLCTEYKKLNH